MQHKQNITLIIVEDKNLQDEPINYFSTQLFFQRLFQVKKEDVGSYNLKYKQKMGFNQSISTLLWVLILVEVSPFPPTVWKTATGVFPGGTNDPQPTSIDTIGSDFLLYTSYFDTASTAVYISVWNATGTLVLISTENPFTLQSEIPIAVNLYGNIQSIHTSTSIFKAFALSPSSGHLTIFDKSTFAMGVIQSYNSFVSGVYLRNNDILLLNSDQEYLCLGSNNMTPVATYVAPSSQIKFIYSQDQTKIYTLYSDLAYFTVRNLTTVADLTASWTSAMPISTPNTGHQCACYSNSLRLLFILDLTGAILVYNERTNNLTTLPTTTYTGMTDCYYDAEVNELVLVNSATGGTTFNNFQLSSYTEATTFSLAGTLFRMDDFFSYFTVTSGNNVEIYAIAVSTCNSSSYFDSASASCLPCLPGCVSCFNGLFCIYCANGVQGNISGLCIDPVVPAPVPAPAPGPVAVETYNDNETLLEKIVNFLLENPALRGVNRTPGSRKVLPFLCFLINIDELQLYMFHERTYGTKMESFFQKLQEFQDEKWELVGSVTTDVLYDQVGTSRDQILEALDTKANYTFPRFRSMEGRGDTFLPACWEFLTFNLLFVLVSFCLLRWGFRKMRKYKISLFLRPFSSLVFLSPMLLDGNLQYFCFLLFTQVQRGFSLNPRDRALTALNYIVYFFVIWFAVVSCFLSYYLTKRLTQYILDNWKTRVKGLLTYSLSNTFRMLVFGGLHSLLRSHPAQLPLLMGAEVIYIVLMLFPMRYWRIHEVAYKVWFAILFAALRICLQISFLSIQAQGVLSSQMDSQFRQIHNCMLFTYLGGIYFATVCEIIYEIIDLAKPSQNKDKPRAVVKQDNAVSIKAEKNIPENKQIISSIPENKQIVSNVPKEQEKEKEKKEKSVKKKKNKTHEHLHSKTAPKSKKTKERKKSLTSRMVETGKKYDYIKIVKINENLNVTEDEDIIKTFKGKEYLWIVGQKESLSKRGEK